ncbi:MAG: hypothetical protein RLZZ28_792, partial [Bacteroidota bacterium]
MHSWSSLNFTLNWVNEIFIGILQKRNKFTEHLYSTTQLFFMIQRIQTLWLLVAAVLAFATLKLSFFSGNVLVNNVKEFKSFTAMSSIPLMILTVAVAITSLITIFLYKDRKLQLKIGLSVLVVS